MKIVSNLLESIEGIQIWYIIGLLIFVVLFIAIFIRTLQRSNNEMHELKNAILIDDDSSDIILPKN